MKMIISFYLLVFSAAVHADPIFLDTLDCGALNGGSLRTVEIRNKVAIVEAQFGLMKATYLASIGALVRGGLSRFDLKNDQGATMITVQASVDYQNRGLQRVSALIGIASTLSPPVAANCEIRVTDWQ